MSEVSTVIPSPERVALALERHSPQFIPALPGRTNHLQAAVMIPLLWGERVESVAILRPQTMTLHRGEVCFPGGKQEEGDEGLAATALRETEEELGLIPIRMLGTLSSIPLFTSDYRILPFVCQVGTKKLIPNPNEVDKALWFSLEDIFSQPVIQGFPVRVGGQDKILPVFEIAGEVMFGATAYALLELLQVISPDVGKVVPPIMATGYVWDWTLLRPVRNASSRG